MQLQNEMKKYKILAIIPARGGSKGVPRKNIRFIAGKPLIAWTIETALQCEFLNRIIVSTDDRKIAKTAREYGAEIPFIRPKELAQDDTTDLPVYQHALKWLAENENYCPEIIVWLRPTVPLRIKEDIYGAIVKLIQTGSDWTRSICLSEHHPYWMYNIEEDRLAPFIEGTDINNYRQRQLLPPVYRVNGAVDVAWIGTITEKCLLYSGNVSAYIMPSERSVDLDTILDFDLAELLIQRRNK